MKTNIVSPQFCMICRFHACNDEFPICEYCLSDFQSLIAKRCRSCGRRPKACECYGENTPRFLFFYGDATSFNLLWWFKSCSDTRTLDFVAELVTRSSGIKPEAYDAITFVPRKQRRVRLFGYDQAKAIAGGIARIYGIPLIETLKRRPFTKDQKLLSAYERKREAKKYFKIKDSPETKLKRILLFDDICTTGATLEACSKLIREHFSKTVSPITLAKTDLYKIKP